MLTICSHNLPGRVDPHARRRILVRLAQASDVIALQEARWLVAADVPEGWVCARGQDPALVILHRGGRFARTGTLDRRAYPERDVGSWGAGPPELRAGWDFGVRLRDREAGEHFWVLDAHLPPSADQPRPAEPRDAEGWEVRRRLHQNEVTQLLDVTSWIDQEPVFVCGDFNAIPGSELLTDMREAFDHVTRSTFGKRAIDYVWYRGATLKEAAELPTASDHDALLATFTI